MWVVIDRVSHEAIGFCGFMRRDEDPEPELMYGFAPRAWGRGLATEAARAAMQYVFDAFGCERMTAATDVPNTASVRVLERLGFRFVRRGLLNGLDTLFYEIDRARFATAPRTAPRSAVREE